VETSVPRCDDRLRRRFERDDPGDRSQGKAWGWILQEYVGCGVALQATSKPAPPGARLWRERAHWNVRNICFPSGQWRTPEPTDLIFPKWQRELFKTILDEEKLRSDREGQPRTACSLRHTYICLRLMEGADIYQIAKNCRTSVEMIEKYYASHIKTSLDAVAINVMRPKKRKSKEVSLADVA